MMPALPGAHLILIHPRLTLTSFETRFNASACFDGPCQLGQRGRRELDLGHTSRAEVVPIAIADVLIGSIWRGLRLQCALVRKWTTGDHEPLFRSRPFTLQTSLHAAFDHLDFHWAFLTISHRQAPPGSRAERLAPIRYRLPRGFRSPSTPLIRGQRRLQVTNGGGAGHAQHIALAPCSQLPAKPRVATQFIIACHPAMGYLITPLGEHLQTLRLSRVIPHLLWHVAFLASLLVSDPVLGQGQAEVEQGMLLARDVSHEDADLTGVDLAPVATPLTLDPHGGRAALGKTAGIEGDDPIGFTPPIGHLSNQHVD